MIKNMDFGYFIWQNMVYSIYTILNKFFFLKNTVELTLLMGGLYNGHNFYPWFTLFDFFHFLHNFSFTSPQFLHDFHILFPFPLFSRASQFATLFWCAVESPLSISRALGLLHVLIFFFYLVCLFLLWILNFRVWRW